MEPLTGLPSFFARPMFGCVACYLEGRLVLLLADRGGIWQGLLLPTDRTMHDSLLGDFRGVRRHPMLGKWLYLPQTADAFAATAASVVEAIAGGDQRLGVEAKAPRLPRPPR